MVKKPTDESLREKARTLADEFNKYGYSVAIAFGEDGGKNHTLITRATSRACLDYIMSIARNVGNKNEVDPSKILKRLAKVLKKEAKK